MVIISSISIIIINLLATGCDNKKLSSPLTSPTPTTSVVPSPTASPALPPSSTPQQFAFAPRVDMNATLLTSAMLGKTDGWFAYLNNGKVEIYHSENSGNTWMHSSLPINNDWEKDVHRQNVFASWHTTQEGPSWILLTSDPAAGQMLKTLYKTSDNGKTWTLQSDLSKTIDDYVTGMTFHNKTDGWIAASHHSSILIPLYRTKDGGKSWEVQTFAIPKGYKYGNPQAPDFSSIYSDQGTLKIEFVSDDKRKVFTYTTSDGGETWTEKK